MKSTLKDMFNKCNRAEIKSALNIVEAHFKNKEDEESLRQLKAWRLLARRRLKHLDSLASKRKVNRKKKKGIALIKRSKTRSKTNNTNSSMP